MNAIEKREYMKAYRDRHHDRLLKQYREYYKANRERILPNARARAARRHKDKQVSLVLKKEFVQAYGGACSCCGETIIQFLTCDHTNNDGATHRRNHPNLKSGIMLYRHLKKLGWPQDGYRLLCFNCNSGRAINGGICPHEAMKRVRASFAEIVEAA